MDHSIRPKNDFINCRAGNIELGSPASMNEPSYHVNEINSHLSIILYPAGL